MKIETPDLFGTTTTQTVKTAPTYQPQLFAAPMFAHVDPTATPAPAPELAPELHTDELPAPAEVDERPEVIDAADLTDADITALAAGATVVDDAYLAARRAATETNDDWAVVTDEWLADRLAELDAQAVAEAHPHVVRAAIGTGRYAALKSAALAAGADVDAHIAGQLTTTERRTIRDAVDGTDTLADLDAVHALLGPDRWNAATDGALFPSTPDHARPAVYRAALLTYTDPITGHDVADLMADTVAEDLDAGRPARRAAVDPDALIATTRRVPSSSGDREWRYVGVVRRAGVVLAACGHEHTNRDHNTRPGGRAAVECARDIIAGADHQPTAEHIADRWAGRWHALTSGTGHTYSAQVVEGTRQAAEADAAAYLAAVAAVAEAAARELHAAAAGLNIRQVGSLLTGKNGANNNGMIVADKRTGNALRRRGLIGADNCWTPLGRRVAEFLAATW